MHACSVCVCVFIMYAKQHWMFWQLSLRCTANASASKIGIFCEMKRAGNPSKLFWCACLSLTSIVISNCFLMFSSPHKHTQIGNIERVYFVSELNLCSCKNAAFWLSCSQMWWPTILTSVYVHRPLGFWPSLSTYENWMHVMLAAGWRLAGSSEFAHDFVSWTGCTLDMLISARLRAPLKSDEIGHKIPTKSVPPHGGHGDFVPSAHKDRCSAGVMQWLHLIVCKEKGWGTVGDSMIWAVMVVVGKQREWCIGKSMRAPICINAVGRGKKTIQNQTCSWICRICSTKILMWSNCPREHLTYQAFRGHLRCLDHCVALIILKRGAWYSV